MKHLNILFLLITLFIGMGVYLTLRQERLLARTRLGKNLGWYIACFNLLALVAVSYQYVLTNLYGNNIFEVPPVVMLTCLLPLYGAQAGMTFFLYRVMLNFTKKEMQPAGIRRFAIWLSVFLLASVIALFFSMQQRAIAYFYWTHAVWIFTVLLIILTALIRLFRQCGRSRHTEGRRFAVLFLAGYGLFGLADIDFYFFRWGLYRLDPIILLVINLLPYLWQRWTLGLRKDVRQQSLAALLAPYGISDREAEIIGLLKTGHSNKEIEARLYISYNTVKNHIYHIYQKLNVNSRSQLLHVISQLGEDSSTM